MPYLFHMSHFDDNNLLSQYQHGFRLEHSCESQLISFTQEVYDNLENGNQTDIIVMDFSKAFDKVDHNKPIYKLSALGIHPLTTRWIKSFLQCRTNKYEWMGAFMIHYMLYMGAPRVSIGSMPFPSIYK